MQGGERAARQGARQGAGQRAGQAAGQGAGQGAAPQQGPRVTEDPGPSLMFLGNCMCVLLLLGMESYYTHHPDTSLV